MSDEVRAYLQAGEALEQQTTPGPWTYRGQEYAEESIEPEVAYNNSADGGGFNSRDDMRFTADARTRLPLYRKALEAVLNIRPDLLVCEKGMGEDLGEKFIRPESIVVAIEAVFAEAEAKT